MMCFSVDTSCMCEPCTHTAHTPNIQTPHAHPTSTTYPTDTPQAISGTLSPQQAHNVWWLQAHQHDVRVAVESLGALAAASRHDDVYGALRLSQPSLGTVCGCGGGGGEGERG